jgi:hypothetical protein
MGAIIYRDGMAVTLYSLGAWFVSGMNEYIRRKLDAQDTILGDITLKQLIWYGHVERMDPMRLPEIMNNWKHEGRKKRGRPRRTWKDGIVTAMSARGLRMDE